MVRYMCIGRGGAWVRVGGQHPCTCSHGQQCAVVQKGAHTLVEVGCPWGFGSISHTSTFVAVAVEQCSVCMHASGGEEAKSTCRYQQNSVRGRHW